MKETMEQELEEAIRVMTQANNALSRIFNVEEGAMTCNECGYIGTEEEGGHIYPDGTVLCGDCEGE